MILKTLLILGMVGLAIGLWVGTWPEVRAKSRAQREWHRVTGEVFGLADPMRPDVRIEQGIEFVPAPAGGYYSPESNERVLEMESDEGLRRFHRYEFLVDPVTHRARVAGVGFTPFSLALIGLVYLGLAVGFYYVTAHLLTTPGGTVAPGEWVYFQPPPWHEPAVASATSHGFVDLYGIGAVLWVVIFFAIYFSREGTLLYRVGGGSVMLFMAGVFAVIALNRCTYRIEADSTGLRESSAVSWRMTPWSALHGAVDETERQLVAGEGSGSGRGGHGTGVYHTAHRVYFTDDQGEESVSISDDAVDPKEAQALVAHILVRTGLKVEKRDLRKK